VAISLNFNAGATNEKAGITVFQNEMHFYYLCRSVEDNKAVVQLYRSVANDKDGKSDSYRMELLRSQLLPGTKNDQQLKIESKGSSYSFYYATQKGKWILLKDAVDAKFLSTKTAGGFVGSMYALYATSLGEKSSSKAFFNWFETNTDEELYK
jgi:xylan 1,4-beta-xylosidase